MGRCVLKSCSAGHLAKTGVGQRLSLGGSLAGPRHVYGFLGCSSGGSSSTQCLSASRTTWLIERPVLSLFSCAARLNSSSSVTVNFVVAMTCPPVYTRIIPHLRPFVKSSFARPGQGLVAALANYSGASARLPQAGVGTPLFLSLFWRFPFVSPRRAWVHRNMHNVSFNIVHSPQAGMGAPPWLPAGPSPTPGLALLPYLSPLGRPTVPLRRGSVGMRH